MQTKSYLKEENILMKKLMLLLFSSVLVFSLAMPVVAQDTGSQDTTKTTKAKKTKATKAKKTKAPKTTEEKK
ncbi:MAG: hypothetical protein ABSB82_15975 [Terriglobia bacterium]|jgi:hypothetical protein